MGCLRDDKDAHAIGGAVSEDAIEFTTRVVVRSSRGGGDQGVKVVRWDRYVQMVASMNFFTDQSGAGRGVLYGYFHCHSISFFVGLSAGPKLGRRKTPCGRPADRAMRAHSEHNRNTRWALPKIKVVVGLMRNASVLRRDGRLDWSGVSGWQMRGHAALTRYAKARCVFAGARDVVGYLWNCDLLYWPGGGGDRSQKGGGRAQSHVILVIWGALQGSWSVLCCKINALMCLPKALSMSWCGRIQSEDGLLLGVRARPIGASLHPTTRASARA